jgi:hypothetical protein
VSPFSGGAYSGPIDRASSYLRTSPPEDGDRIQSPKRVGIAITLWIRRYFGGLSSDFGCHTVLPN